MKIALLVIYFAVMVGIGIYCRKHATDVNGFVLGGRSVGPWLTAFAYGTSYFSAVVFVGYAGQFGWKYGVAATWAGIGNAILGSLVAWVVLGRRTRIMTQHLNCATMPQFFGQRFQQQVPEDRRASVIVFVFLIPYTASLFNGLSRLFGMAFHIDYSVCVIVMGGSHRRLCHRRRLHGHSHQRLHPGLHHDGGHRRRHCRRAPQPGRASSSRPGQPGRRSATPAVLNGTVPGIFASFFGPDPMNLLGVVVLTTLGTWGLPQMVQKFYAIHSRRKAIAQGHDHLHPLRPGRLRRLLLPGRLRPAVLRPGGHCRRRLRRHHPHHALRLARYPASPWWSFWFCPPPCPPCPPWCSPPAPP